MLIKIAFVVFAGLSASLADDFREWSVKICKMSLLFGKQK